MIAKFKMLLLSLILLVVSDLGVESAPTAFDDFHPTPAFSSFGSNYSRLTVGTEIFIVMGPLISL
jgi:hypothetical protein